MTKSSLNKEKAAEYQQSVFELQQFEQRKAQMLANIEAQKEQSEMRKLQQQALAEQQAAKKDTDDRAKVLADLKAKSKNMIQNEKKAAQPFVDEKAKNDQQMKNEVGAYEQRTRSEVSKLQTTIDQSNPQETAKLASRLALELPGARPGASIVDLAMKPSQLIGGSVSAAPQSGVVQVAESEIDAQPNLKTDIKTFTEIINEVRGNPQKYAQIVATKYLAKFDGTTHVPSQRVYSEGPEAFAELRNLLQSMQPLAYLTVDAGLTAIALLKAKRLAQINRIQPFSDSEFSRWLPNYNTGVGVRGASVSVSKPNYEDIVINLLAGDGDHSRSAQLALLQPGFCNIGVAVFRKSNLSDVFASVTTSGDGIVCPAGRLGPNVIKAAGLDQYQPGK